MRTYRAWIAVVLGAATLSSISDLAAEDRATLTQFYRRYDKNSDGRLEPKEWKSSRMAKAIEEAILDGVIGNNYEEAYEYLLKIKDKYIEN